MKVHIVIDFMFIYYKYKNTLMSGRLKTLSAKNPVNPSEIIDISMVYYPLREIETLRRKYESDGAEVTVSVCFDSPSNRRDDDCEYKGKRKKTLGDRDFENISLIRKILDRAGHNVYKVDGVEADDLVYSIIEDSKYDFDATVIFTTDYDLLVNVQSKVYYRKYRAGKGYEDPVGIQNFSNYVVSNGFCETMQYNGILLYKCIFGDRSDNIPGIKGIGKAKFDNLVRKCIENHFIGTVRKPFQHVAFEWSELRDPNNVNALLMMMCEKGMITDEQLGEAQHSLKLVAPRYIGGLNKPIKISTVAQREVIYGLYSMPSLVE